MSRLYFECNFKSDELRSLDLPVEVRKPNFVLVSRSLSSRSVEVKPGIYHITVKLPAGQELYTRIQVVEGTDAKVVLTPEPEDVPLHEWQEVDLYLGGQLPTTASQDSSSEPLAPGQVKARLRAFIGNVLKSNYKAIDVSDWKRSVRKLNRVARLGISGRNRTQLVQLLQPQKPPVNMFLPAWDLSECFVVFTQLPNGQCSLNVRLKNILADLLLRYLEKGLLEEVSITVTSENLEVEKLLHDKRKDPVAATVAAYALLRLGELEQLHDWTRNLRNWFKGLPDGIVIRAEHLARLGKHDQALTVLLELPLQGLPIFTDGLSYAINRLRLYISLGESHFEKVKLFHAQDLLEQLQRFATFVDFSRSILTFTGIIPGNPNDEPLPEDVDSYEGLNLTDYLGSLEHQQQRGTHKENQLEPLSERYIFDVLLERFWAVMQLIKEPQVIFGVVMILCVTSGPLPALTKPLKELSKQDLVQQFKIAESQLSETKDNKILEKFMEAILELQRLILEKANELNELHREETEIENIARLESEIAELEAIEKRINASREALSLLNPETQQEYLKALSEEAGDAALVAHPELKNPGGGADSIENIQQFYFNIENFLFLIYNCLIVCRPKLLDMALADEDNPLEPLPATAYVAAFKFIRDQKIADAIPSEAAKELTAYFDYLIEKLVSTT